MMRLLSVESVSLRLWRGDRSMLVLNDVSFDLEAGELGGVWGDRCAGKTTLARVVAGVLSPDQGRVVLDGDEVTTSSRRHRRVAIHARIGLAARGGPKMPELPVREWIASSLLTSCGWSAALRQAEVVLDRVGAGDTGSCSWAHLSDSERSLVVIAYALARNPRLLVVDDLFAGLGGLSQVKVMDLLREIAGTGVAVLMAGSELSNFKSVDRIWSLSGGRLAGPPARPGAEVVELRPTGGSSRLPR